MGQKKSEFDKVFSAWDILVIAFGAMIGYLPEHGSMPVVLSEQHLPLQSVVS